MLYCTVYPGGEPVHLKNKTHSDGRVQAESIKEMQSLLNSIIQFDRHWMGADWEDFALPFSIVDENGNELASLSTRDLGWGYFPDLVGDHGNSGDGTT